MKTKSFTTPLCSVLFGLVLGSSSPISADGFPAGNLLVLNYDGLYLVDPTTGGSQRIVTGLPSSVGDVVYNPVSNSAFVTVDRRDILEIKFTQSGSYQISTFLANIDGVIVLTVDHFGNLYFNEQQFVDHRILKASLDGHVQPVSDDVYFVPTDIALSADESKLYVAESPSQSLQELDLATEKSREFPNPVEFPEGLAILGPGDILVAENTIGTLPRVVRMRPDGSRSIYARSDSTESRFGDIEYDPRNGTLFVAGGNGIYAYKSNGSTQHVTTIGSWSGGFAIIGELPAGIISRQPNSLVVGKGDGAEFTVAAGNAGPNTRYQWRFNGGDLPGATKPTLRLEHVEASDVGTYNVLVITDQGAALSQDAMLGISSIRLQPVLELSGPTGAHYRIHYREAIHQNGASWTELTNVVSTSNPYFFLDSTAPESGQRFYRAELLP